MQRNRGPRPAPTANKRVSRIEMAWRCFMDAGMRVNQASDFLTITLHRVIVKRGPALF
jgi:hypothetical protein